MSTSNSRAGQPAYRDRDHYLHPHVQARFGGAEHRFAVQGSPYNGSCDRAGRQTVHSSEYCCSTSLGPPAVPSRVDVTSLPPMQSTCCGSRKVARRRPHLCRFTQEELRFRPSEVLASLSPKSCSSPGAPRRSTRSETASGTRVPRCKQSCGFPVGKTAKKRMPPLAAFQNAEEESPTQFGDIPVQVLRAPTCAGRVVDLLRFHRDTPRGLRHTVGRTAKFLSSGLQDTSRYPCRHCLADCRDSLNPPAWKCRALLPADPAYTISAQDLQRARVPPTR